MNVNGYYVAPNTVPYSPFPSYSCSCACQTCMSGACCMWKTGPLTVGRGSDMQITPAKPCDWLGHEFKPTLVDNKVYCSRCAKVETLDI